MLINEIWWKGASYVMLSKNVSLSSVYQRYVSINCAMNMVYMHMHIYKCYVKSTIFSKVYLYIGRKKHTWKVYGHCHTQFSILVPWAEWFLCYFCGVGLKCRVSLVLLFSSMHKFARKSHYSFFIEWKSTECFFLCLYAINVTKFLTID